MRCFSGFGDAVSTNPTKGDSHQLHEGPSVPLNLSIAEISRAETCPFILIRSAKRSTEVMGDMKRVDGD